MSELLPRRSSEIVNENFQPELDKGSILNKLFEIKDRYGIDIEEEDLEDLLGTDDNDFLGNLVSLIADNGIFDTAEDFLRELGLPTEYEVNARALLEMTIENE